MGGRKLRVAGLVTKKPLGKTLAPPTKGVGGYWHIISLFLCAQVSPPSFPNRALSPSCIYFRCGAHACTISAPLKVARFTAQKLLAIGFYRDASFLSSLSSSVMFFFGFRVWLYHPTLQISGVSACSVVVPGLKSLQPALPLAQVLRFDHPIPLCQAP